MPRSPLLLWALACTLLGACSRPDDEARTPPRIALTECRLPHYEEAVQCASLQVPENRDAPGGSSITLKIALFPAHARVPRADALFLLAGGPGQGATEVFPRAMGAFERVRRERDIVLVDQRGTGGSNALKCPALERRRQELASSDVALPPALIRECLPALPGDPRHYATRQFVADLEAVRDALGYPRIDLWGGSYGTRAALEYLRRYPGRVRSVVLDGVVPPAMRVYVDAARTSEEAMERLLADCAAEPPCGKAYPDLRSELSATMAALEDRPRKLTLADSATGEPVELEVTRPLAAGAIGQFLYSPEAAVIVPQLVTRAHRGDYAPLFANVLRPTNEFQSVVPGLLLSVLCAEDATRLTDADLRAPAGLLRGQPIARELRDICALWPHDGFPAELAQPVTSDVPVLLLSGALDPVTPPQWGALAARTLSHSRHFIAPGYGHLVTPHGCAPRLVAQFVRDASAEGLDGTCLTQTRRPAFFVNQLGPAS
jgi:pimeloyl-ACP methyl ester carboxylesterase